MRLPGFDRTFAGITLQCTPSAWSRVFDHIYGRLTVMVRLMKFTVRDSEKLLYKIREFLDVIYFLARVEIQLTVKLRSSSFGY
jgi:hypothetical protein